MSQSMNLANLDDAFAAAMAPRRKEDKAARLAAMLPSLASPPRVHNGIYTLTLPDGGHRTFRIWTQNPDARFAPGRRMVALLIGPENTEDYETIAFLEDAGPVVWKRFCDGRAAVHLGILWQLANGERVAGCALAVSRHCMICNRILTEPESIDRGIGPTCWGRLSHGSD